MKHLKVLSIEKPVKAEDVAWVQLKDLIGPNIPKAGAGFIAPATVNGNMTAQQTEWLAMQWDNWLQK